MTTITREQFEAACRAASCGKEGVRAIFAAAGITVAKPKPPEAMVRLAREIAKKAEKDCFDDGVVVATTDYTLAALQHAADVVNTEEKRWGRQNVTSACAIILRKLGADA